MFDSMMCGVIGRRLASAIAVAGLVCGTAIAIPGGASAQEDSLQKQMSREELQQMYMDHLAEEGYRPKIDDDGDVTFKAEGLMYFIPIKEDDPEFFSIVLPGFWICADDAEIELAYKCAASASRDTKVTKVFLVEDRVWASAEVFVEKPSDFEPIFARTLSALQTGSTTFARLMREGQTAGAE